MKKVKIENLEQEIDFIENDIGIKGIDYEGISTSPTNEITSVVENTVIAHTEKIEYLQGIMSREQLDIDKVDRVLEELEDTERVVLIEKYINSKQWWQVASRVCYSERHCKRIKDNAINKMIIGMYNNLK